MRGHFDRSLHVLNAPSPAATSSLAIGRHIARALHGAPQLTHVTLATLSGLADDERMSLKTSSFSSLYASPVLTCALMSWTPPAWAQAGAQPPTAQPTALPTQATSPAPTDQPPQPVAATANPVTQPPAPQLSPSAAPAEPPVWQVALTQYEIGQSQEAADLLRQEILACTVQQQKPCSTDYLGTLYASLGIVLSGGQNQHDSGVQAFRKALTLSPEIVIYPTYQTVPIMRAYNEARTGEREARVASPDEGEQNQDVDDPPEAEPKGRSLFMFKAGVQGGPSSLYHNNFLTSGSIDQEEGTGINLTGRLTAIGMPGSRSGFSLGGRLLGGATFIDEFHGFFAASLVIGSTVGKRRDNTCLYFFGSGGLFYLPTIDQAMPTVGFEGGVVLKGFTFGLVSDLTLSSDYQSALFGLEVGWSNLLM